MNRQFAVLLCAALIALLIAGCAKQPTNALPPGLQSGEQPPSVAPDNAAETRPTPPQARPQQVAGDTAAEQRTTGPRAVGLQIGDQYEEGIGITQGLAILSAKTDTIHLTTQFEELEPGTTVSAALIALSVRTADAKTMSNQRMASLDMTIPAAGETAHLSFAKPEEGWPAGPYAVTISLGEEIIGGANFRIR